VGAGFAAPLEIGLGCEVKPTATGTLYLRVNASAGRLADNHGTLNVTIGEAIESSGGEK
jgi:hypothetical protein